MNSLNMLESFENNPILLRLNNEINISKSSNHLVNHVNSGN